MAPVADAPLAELCREADPATATAFVADLYEARGWAVDRQSGRRLLVSDGDRETRLGVVHPADGRPIEDLAAWADALVDLDGSAAIPGDVEVIGAADLGRQLAYAVDRPAARALLRSHFGWSPSDESDDSDVEPSQGAGDTAGGGSGAGAGTASHRLPWPAVGQPRALLVAVVVIAVAGGVTVAVADQIGGQGSTGDPAEGVTPTPTPTATPIPTETGAGSDEGTPTPPERTPTPNEDGEQAEQFANLPPGISQSEDVDPRQLARVHSTLLANQSYRLSLTYREFVDGDPAGVYRETIHVANATHYSARVTSRGAVEATPFTIAERDVYADGVARYERINGSAVEQSVLLTYDRFLDDYMLYLLWFLNVRDATVIERQSTGGTGTFYIATEGNSDPSIRNATGSLVVTEDGLVRDAHWSYDLAGTPGGYSNLSASVSLRVSDVGSATVRKPDWVNSASAGTNASG